MMRLTLRSGKDGRFLARVVDPGGVPFVLDFGDERLINDIGQRLAHGFSIWRHGRLLSAGPHDPELLKWLAEHYAGEGMLVFLEEPSWPSRSHSLEDRLPGPAMAEVHEVSAAEVDPQFALDDETELIDEAALAALDAPDAPHLVPELSDAPTERFTLDDIPSVDDYLLTEEIAAPPAAPAGRGRKR